MCLARPEYVRRRCGWCGDFYFAGHEFMEVGLCRYCARSSGLYVIPKVM